MKAASAYALVALAVAGCASVQSNSAIAVVKDDDYGTVFRDVTSAAVLAGFTITSAVADTGQIVASGQASKLLNDSNPAINIAVVRAGAGVQIRVTDAVSRTMGGQIIDSGNPRSAMQGFCDSLVSILPAATCAVQQDAHH